MTADLTPAYATALPAPQGGALPTSLEWQALERMANTLADSDVIPYRLKRKPADIAVILLAAREYGIPPLMAMSKLPVVNGTPAPMGELMVALVLRAGHRITAKVHNPDGTIYKAGPITRDHYATCRTLRREEAAGDEDELTFTVAEAEAAGLVSIEDDGTLIARDSKGQPTPWELYPANMLRWRAVANACRLRFPDVLLGLSYLPEELGAVVDAEGAPIRVVEHEEPRTAPPTSLALRTAQETADRAAEESRAEVLANVLEWSVANDLVELDVTTTAPDGTRNRLPLGVYLRQRIDAANIGVVDGVVESPTAAASSPQEPATAPADPPAPTGSDELTKAQLGIAEATVYDALRERNADAVRAAYRESKDAGLLDVDVAASLTDDNRRELKLIDGDVVKLGAALMALGARLAAGKDPLVVDGPTDDEPAEGWPTAEPGDPTTAPL